MQTKIISTHSFRGGTGKSNVTANLAAMLAANGHRVGVFDTDIQSPGIHIIFGLNDVESDRTLNAYLRGECAIEEAAHLVYESSMGGTVHLVPSSIAPNDIARILRERYDAAAMQTAFRDLNRILRLDYLLIDTHPGLNEETLLSVAISDVLVIILRPDRQDFEGTGVTVDVARRLRVPEVTLVVNKVPPEYDLTDVHRQIEQTYRCDVAALLPLSIDVADNASASVFCLTHPDHAFTNGVRQLAMQLERRKPLRHKAMFVYSLRRTLRDLQARKRRALFVIFTIALSVIGPMAVVGTRATLEPQLLSAFLRVNPADVTVTTTGVSAEFLASLREIENVARVEGVFVFHTRHLVDEKWEPLKIIAVPDFAAKEVNQITVESGELPGANGLLMERAGLSIRDVAPGESLIVQTPTGSQSIPVSGIAWDPTIPAARVQRMTTAFMRLDSAETLLGDYDFNEVQVRVRDDSRTTATATTLIEQIQADDLPVFSFKNRIPGDYPGRGAFVAVLQIMSLIGFFTVCLCSFIVIHTISTIMATETSCIGTMKMLGATCGIVIRSYLRTVLGYCIPGTLLGLLGGLLAINALAQYMAGIANAQIDILRLPPSAVLLVVLIVGVLLPGVTTLVPIVRATGVSVHDALIDHGIIDDADRAERLLARLTRRTGTGMTATTHALRNLLRRRGRSLLTIIGLTVAGSCFVAVHATNASLNRTVDAIANTIDADVFTLFTLPVEQNELEPIVRDARQGAEVEFWLRQVLPFGDREVLVHGVPPNTAFYAHDELLIAGRWFKDMETDTIILTEKFARDNLYSVGDRITLGVGNTRERRTIIGIVSDYTNQGYLFLMPYSELAELLGTPSQTNMVSIRLADGAPQTVNNYLSGYTARMLATGFEADIVSLEELRAAGTSQLRVIVSLLLGMVLLISVVGVLGLIGTLMISVNERVREISVMRVLGAGNWEVARVFWLEGVCMGLVSWLLVTAVSLPVTRAFAALLDRVLFPLDFTLPWHSLLLLGISLMTIVSIAGVVPALLASRMRVATGMRYG